MTVALLTVFIVYGVIILVMIAGNVRLFSNSPHKAGSDVQDRVSVIVAARNEQDMIGNLLNDLRKNKHINFEVIIVDDHSEDRTTAIVQRFSGTDGRFRLIANNGQGKKAALTTGIGASSGSLILTIDADCRVGPDWIASMSAYFENGSTQLVLGPVRLNACSFFDFVQSVEFSSLIGSASAMAGWGIPILANGANLAFRKTAFESVHGYAGNQHVPSGDDEFLLRKIKNVYANGIEFANTRQSVVTTRANSSLKEFLHQRIRWAGKWRLHSDRLSQAVALFVFSFQAIVVSMPFLVAAKLLSLSTVIMLISSKVILEFLFLRLISHYLDAPWKLSAFWLLQLVYPYYVVFTGFLANFRSYEWKGRKIKTVVVNSR